MRPGHRRSPATHLALVLVLLLLPPQHQRLLQRLRRLVVPPHGRRHVRCADQHLDEHRHGVLLGSHAHARYVRLIIAQVLIAGRLGKRNGKR